MSRKELFGITSALFTLALLAPQPAPALEFRGGETVIIGPEEVVEGDLYVSAETVTVEGTIEGDLVAAGRELRVSGRVEGDLIAAGQAVVIEGVVMDDVRMAGMVLLLGEGSSVGDHVVSAGYGLEVASGSSVGGSLLFKGAKALVAGDIAGSLSGDMNGLEISGSVGGDVSVGVTGGGGPDFFLQLFPSPVPVPQVSGGLTVGEAATIGGLLSYRSPEEGSIADGAFIAGGVDWDEVVEEEPSAVDEVDAEVGEEPAPRARWAERLRPHLKRFGSLLVVGLLLLAAVPAWARARADRLQAEPLAGFGWGLLAYVAGPAALLALLVASIFLAVILGSLKLGGLAAATVFLGLLAMGLLFLLYLVALLWVAPTLAGFTLGRWALGKVGMTEVSGRFLALLLGLVVYVLLRAVPWLGGAVGILAMIWGLGALGAWILSRRRVPAPPSDAPAA